MKNLYPLSPQNQGWENDAFWLVRLHRLCIKVGRGQGDGDMGRVCGDLGLGDEGLGDVKYGTRGRGDVKN